MSPRDVPGRGGARVSVLLLALLCLATGGLVGWQLRGEPARPPSYLAQLTAALDLRPDQVARLETVLADEDYAIDTLIKGRFDSVKDSVAARRQQTEQALVALLDASQRARYEQLLGAGVAGTGETGAAGGERGR